MKYSLSIGFGLIALMSFGQVNQVDSQGRKQGKWEKVYPGTKVYVYRGEFTDDNPVGKFSYFYKSSKVKAIIKHNEITAGRSVAYYYHENGVLMSHGIYKNLKKDSIWQNFGPSGRISNKETYLKDSLHGAKVIYYVPEVQSDKSVIPSAIINYKNGVKHGEYKEFFNSRVVKLIGKYENGKKVGAWQEFHLNGKRSSTIRYKNGMKHGWAVAYDTDEKRLIERFFYYGRLLEGHELEEKLKQLEKLGIDPNE